MRTWWSLALGCGSVLAVATACSGQFVPGDEELLPPPPREPKGDSDEPPVGQGGADEDDLTDGDGDGGADAGDAADAADAAPDPCDTVFTGTVYDTLGLGLHIRTEPKSAAASRGKLPDDSRLEIYCQVDGEIVQGTSRWNYLGKGWGYVSDKFVRHDSTARPPRCNDVLLECRPSGAVGE